VTRDLLKAEFVFDRPLVGGPDRDALPNFARVLFAAAPAWSSKIITWSPEPRERHEVGDATSSSSLLQVVADRTRWATERRYSGSVELRGATRELIPVVSVNSYPLARVGGALLLSNAITVTALTKKIGGIPQTEWMRSVFDNLCEALNPVWGALYTHSEYTAKVMAQSPSLRAVGRDFCRYLPGLFPVNHFGPKYVELIGERKLRQLRTASARRLGQGWIVDVIPDPFSWDTTGALLKNSEAVNDIGREFFFRKDSAGEETLRRAPDWD
jgi:hypothetical protein